MRCITCTANFFAQFFLPFPIFFRHIVLGNFHCVLTRLLLRDFSAIKIIFVVSAETAASEIHSCFYSDCRPAFFNFRIMYSK